MHRNRLLALALAVLLAPLTLRADEPPKESDYYAIRPYAIPEGVVLEAGGLEMMPDGRLAVATRRGEIYLVEHPDAADPAVESKFTRWAHGLHEVLGLAWRDGWLYATQRGELSRLKDSDGDGRADVFEDVADSWGVSGDYHEYAIGSKFDRDGFLWIALTLTGSFTSDAPLRGWALRVSADGKQVIPTCSGLRSPGGLGMDAAGAMYYTENQGPWNGACALKHLEPGTFVGHPGGLSWYGAAKAYSPLADALLGDRPADPQSHSRMAVEVGKIPKLRAPAVYLPYRKMGQSASGIACDLTGGAFGPFREQLFVADQAASTLMRVDLETVDGRRQGACFPFREGFGSGNVPILFGPSGKLYVGGTGRGWGSRGGKPFALERLDWTGKVPFEILNMKVQPDGFVLGFTQPVNLATASDPKAYRLSTYTYIYQPDYGSPEVDGTVPTIGRVEVAGDGLSARLFVEGLQVGHVHELHAEGVRSAEGSPLLHPEAYYTLNALPH